MKNFICFEFQSFLSFDNDENPLENLFFDWISSFISSRPITEQSEPTGDWSQANIEVEGES